MPTYVREPTNRELRERVVAALKAETQLFENVSVRLIADFVDRYGLTTIPVEPDTKPAFDLGILVVPDKTVNLIVTTIRRPLPRGVYLRNKGWLANYPSFTSPRLQAAGRDPVRAFYLGVNPFAKDLPRVLVNALDLGEAEDIILM